jgi:hypothetical protein
MNGFIIAMLLVIIGLFWITKYQIGKKLDRLIKIIEVESKANRLSKEDYLTYKDYLSLLFHRVCDIWDCTAQMHSIATKENPAGANFHEYIKSDNLAKIYANYLERFENLPQNLAIKRARFEVAQFGQDIIIEKINSDFSYGEEQQRKEKFLSDFFSSGIIEKDIKNRLEEKRIIPYDLFSPLYDLIVKQSYTGEKDFATDLTTYTVKSYDEMVNHAAIITRLEQLGILLRTSGENWGDFLKFRLKLTDMIELKNLIYSGESSHDDDFFEERFSEGNLPRIFDAHDLRLVLR